MSSSVVHVTREELLAEWNEICRKHGVPSNAVEEYVASHELTQDQYFAVQTLLDIAFLLNDGRLDENILG